MIDGVQWLIAIPFGIGSFYHGRAGMATTVVSGIHHMYTVIDLGQLGAYGLTFWLPLASAANGRRAARRWRSRSRPAIKKLKSMALPASLSAFGHYGTRDLRCEPALFPVRSSPVQLAARAARFTLRLSGWVRRVRA